MAISALNTYYDQNNFTIISSKGGFFQKMRFVFQISQFPKKIFQKTILSLKFEIPAHISKQLIQNPSLGFFFK